MFADQKICGIGILNLEKFARALRLRWLWFEWKEDSKPWINMQTPCDEIDRALFREGTSILIGNGKKIKFWKDNWLDGRSPKELALLICRLAKRKSNCLKMDLENNHWLSLLNQITSLEEIDELIQLGSQLQNVTLLQDCPDDISWKWTDNGQYSAKSAYLAQFQGYITHAPFKPIWTTQAEPKQRFFGWILLHQRALTAENLLKRRWPCDWDLLPLYKRF